jgi:hypothetical protein
MQKSKHIFKSIILPTAIIFIGVGLLGKNIALFIHFAWIRIYIPSQTLMECTMMKIDPSLFGWPFTFLEIIGVQACGINIYINPIGILLDIGICLLIWWIIKKIKYRQK